jgi:hypothetical protein
MSNEIKKKILIITDRPLKWSNSNYRVLTIYDIIYNKYKFLHTNEKLQDDIQTMQIKLSELKKELNYLEKKINEIKRDEYNLYRYQKLYNEKKEEVTELTQTIENSKNIDKKNEQSELYNIIIIDDSITQNDIHMYNTDFDFDLFNELEENYIEKYSIWIKPNKIHNDKTKMWYKLGTFKVNKNVMYSIFSLNEYVELKFFFDNKKQIVELRKELKNDDFYDDDILEEKIKIAKEQRYQEKNQKKVEIVFEKIHNVNEYISFIKNRIVFSNFIHRQKIIRNEDDLNNRILETKSHHYSNNILKKIRDKYTDNIFPYDKMIPLSIFYVIVLHNDLNQDKTFEKKKKMIANTIGDFREDHYMKGIIIQSFSFLSIPKYYPVQLLQISNTDKYIIWMKPEKKRINNTHIFETHMNSFNFVKNNLKKKGGNKTYKRKLFNLKNKTVSIK